MQALTEKQQGFVLAMAADPFGNPTKWARAAGYRNSEGGMRVKGHTLFHDPRIQTAVQELGSSALKTLGPMLAAAGMLRIARNPKHKQHFKALEAIANRVGMHETTEHKVTVDHKDRSPRGLEQRLTRALDRLRTLGRLSPEMMARLAPPAVDAEFKVVDGK